MRKLHKFLALAPGERMLLVSAAMLVTAVRAGTWVLPFRTVRRLVARLSRPSSARRDGEVTSERIAWAVDAAGKRIPGGRNCLVQALATQVLLDRHRQPAQLRIGVAKGPTGEFEAHAWVESDGKVIIGGGDISRFVVLPALEGERA